MSGAAVKMTDDEISKKITENVKDYQFHTGSAALALAASHPSITGRVVETLRRYSATFWTRQYVNTPRKKYSS